MFDPTQNALIARKLGDTPLGLYGTRDYLDRMGRPERMEDLLRHDVLGFDRSEDIIKGYAQYGFTVTRHQFPVRCDDQVVGWQLMNAGAGLGFAQVRLAGAHPHLERVDDRIGMQLPPLPIWLVMHEEVRINARIRRVADFLADAIVAWLRI
jgi:DNA-binding transcriptional LysR family regulator